MFARTTLITSVGVAVGLAGCSAPPMPPPPGLDHPANPQAAAVPVPPPSDTLAVDAGPTQPVPPPLDESAVPQRATPGAMRPTPGTAGGGGSMGGMDRMGTMDGMPGMGRPATAPAAGGGR